MATNVGNLVASLEMRAGQFISEQRRASKSLATMEKRLANFGKRVRAAVTALAGLAVVTQGFRKLNDTARGLGILQAQLKVATGSAEGAAFAFQKLEKFAARTPFSLEQSVAGFVKLVNLGLEPSERALESYGNTAAATGKQLSDFIEAVADASVAEFERLKEFGIKAKNQGETIKFIFRGSETTVANSSRAIQNFLIKIGETDFAGSLQERANSLDGALSNLEDAYNSLFRTITEKGFGQSQTETVRNLTEAVEALDRAIATYLTRANDASTGSSGLKVVFSFLGEAALRVSAAFEKIATRLAGIAAAAKFLFQFDLTSALSINDMVTADIAEINAQLEKAVANFAALRNGGPLPGGGGSTPTSTPSAEGSNVDPDGGLGQFEVKGAAKKEPTLQERMEILRQARLAEKLREIVASQRTKTEIGTELSQTIEGAIVSGAESGAKGMIQVLLSQIQRNLVSQVSGLIAGAISGGGGAGGGIGGFFAGLFDSGGVVPGPKGAPRLAVVHAGETVLPTHKGGGMVGGVTVNQNLTINGGNRAELLAAVPHIIDATRAAVQDDMTRRGR